MSNLFYLGFAVQLLISHGQTYLQYVLIYTAFVVFKVQCAQVDSANWELWPHHRFYEQSYHQVIDLVPFSILHRFSLKEDEFHAKLPVPSCIATQHVAFTFSPEKEINISWMLSYISLKSESPFMGYTLKQFLFSSYILSWTKLLNYQVCVLSMYYVFTPEFSGSVGFFPLS